MKSFRHHLKSSSCLLILFLIVLLSGRSEAQSPPRPGKPGVASPPVREGTGSPESGALQPTRESEKFVSIDFNNVDISVLIKFISELTGRNFIVDQRVKGKVTIISPAKISVKEAFKVFESVLEVHGFTTVAAGEVIKIVPSPEARSMNIETRLRAESLAPEDKIVTQITSLKYADAADIKRLLTPLVSKNSVILEYPPTNMLIITDVLSNIQRLRRILDAIDITGVGQELSVIPLQFADATKLVQILTSIFKPTRPPTPATKTDPEKTFTFVADERTNTVVAVASMEMTLRVKRLIGMLDKEAEQGKGKIRVYYLENASAEDLAKVLMDVPSKTGTTPTTAADKAREAPAVSGKVRITADKATNSLIIMAENEDYVVLEEIIAKLDIPRAMVYMEVLIMEVNVTKNFNVGTQWTAVGKTRIDGNDAFFGGGFGGGIPLPTNDPTGTGIGSLLSPSQFALGVIGSTIEFTVGGVPIKLPNIGAIINAFKTDRDVHILSTPQILTTDNEEARITVGENRPFQTRTTVTSAGNETFNSFEYRDVGKILKIKPHISKERLVRLTISLEVTSVAGGTTAVNLLPTTSKRTVDTNVIVRDGHTVVIGGLIDDSIDKTRGEVPCLGSIPGAGWLFKNVDSNNTKTNLFIFMTPHVIQSPAEADAVSRQKRKEMDQIEEGKIKLWERTGKEPENLLIQPESK